MPANLHCGVSEQSKAGKHRLEEARLLFSNSHLRGAMYLAGYSVECLLKTKLMRTFTCWNLRELEEELARRGLLATDATVFTHHLERLLGLLPCHGRLRKDQAAWRQFNVVNRWIPAWRYSPDRPEPDEAEVFFFAIDHVGRWIENNF
jgi:HEPN domain-containing protein